MTQEDQSSELRESSPEFTAHPPGVNANRNIRLGEDKQGEPRGLTKQVPLDLGVEIQRDINGIEMGVLENGVAYLTQGGLARVTGADVRSLRDLTQEWEVHYADDVLRKDRISFLKDRLFKDGYKEPTLYIETIRNGQPHYAYPDIVCLAIVEYYAFESANTYREAIDNYRRFASYGLRKFIYDSLQYTPCDSWKYYHDRVSLLNESAPTGYFIVFKETGGLIVDLISADLTVNEKTIPDISIGQSWARHWKSNGLSEKYGERIPFKHNYPDYYPQSVSNPQDANAYPDEALPEFRRWFKETYLSTKFPAYILQKAHLIPGGRPEAERIASLYQEPRLPR